MIHTVHAVRTLQAVAMAVGISLFLWGTGLPTFFHSVEAASITNASDTLSNSAPGQLSDHTIAFTTENGLAVGQTIEITFPAQFTIDKFGADDMDLTDDAADQTLANGSAGVGQWGVATTSTTITLTTPTDGGVGSSSAMIVYLGQVGPNAGSSEEQITNPSATSSYQIDIGGTMTDSGSVRVAIIDDVTVSASVDTSLTFTVAGVDAGVAINGSPTTTTATTSHVALPFGTLDVNTSKTLAQRLTVATNATNGYTVTVEQTGELQSTTGATIDGFIDGSWTQTPTTWQAPGAQISDTDTYGHWGLTSTDGTTTRSSEFSSDTWVSGSTTPIVIMGHTGPSDGTTDGVGSSTIGYQIEISALQEAGDDYTTTLRYVATPTF